MKKVSAESKKLINIKRLGTSPYFSDTFLLKELTAINEIEYISMSPMESKIDCELLITNTHIKLDRNQINNYPNLKCIIHSNSGFDNIDIEFVKEKKIPIIIGNEIRAHAVANYILTAFFSHYNQLPIVNNWDNQRTFNRKDLRELKVLIVGLGHIGKILVNTLDNVVNHIHIYDPFKGHQTLPDIPFDVVIPVASLNPSSYHFIDKSFLKKISPSYLLINASRGEIINTHDLVESLKISPNAYAYLDVFEKEPHNFLDFKELKNISLTSHIAGVFNNIEEDTIKFEKKVINDYITLSKSDFDQKYFDQNLLNKIYQDFNGKEFLI